MKPNYSTDRDDPIKDLTEKRVPWLSHSQKTGMVAISTRIRLARNLVGFPFPCHAENSDREKILSLVGNVVAELPQMEHAFAAEIHKLNKIDRQILFERHLISREHKTTKKTSGVIVSNCETCSIMINEEDHLRLQVLEPGLALTSIWNKIDQVDDLLSQQLTFAYHQEFGYLTSCPTNVGTGLRASVMLHLPALVFSSQIDAVIRALKKMRLTTRGLFGEGSESVGNLFQISNQATLGLTEDCILVRLEKIVAKIIKHEINARNYLLENKENKLYDFIGRSFGSLRYSYTIGADEAMNLLSAVRLGIELGMFNFLNIADINDMIIKIQPGHLQKCSNAEFNTKLRDKHRAEFIRERLDKKN